MGSMDKKSRGRGRRGPIWEVQCKQSRFLIIPAHVRNWTRFDVLPQRALHPPIPSSQTALLRASRGKRVDSVLGQAREASSTLWHTEKWDERMWRVKSCAELTGAWPSFILTDLFMAALKGQFNITKYKIPKILREEEKKVEVALNENRWSFYDVL